MERYELAEAAQRARISPDRLRQLVELGVIAPDVEGRFTTGHVLRAELVESLVAAGIPLDGLGAAIQGGQVSLDFLDALVFDRFSARSGDTFAQLGLRTGVSVELLSLIREDAGSSPAPREVGSVELKGVAGAMRLYAASGSG
jgi:DNA-binding transcriptional MerR regulator